MSTEPTRGHVPSLSLGRYRMIRHAADGAIDAARELARLGDDDLADQCREAARRLRREARELRVILADGPRNA